MKIHWSLVIYNVICNIPVCFFLCLASSLSAAMEFGDGVVSLYLKDINWLTFLLNFGVSFILAMCIGTFLPLTAIGRWFTGLFGVKNDTYTGNMKYRLLSTLIITIIYFLIISPSLTILNYFILRNMTFQECMISWLLSVPLMLLVGFVSSLISDIGAYKIAHSVDKNF